MLKSIEQGLRERKELRVVGLQGSAGAYLLSRLAEETESPRVVLVRDGGRAERLASDLRFFLPSPKEIQVFPSWEVLPFDNASPYIRIQCRRLEILRRLLGGAPPSLLIVPVEAWMSRLPPREWLQAQGLFLSRGLVISMQEAVRRIEGNGYQRVPLVEEVGDFSIRGGILDCFPPEMDAPVRMDFAEDQIESIRAFSPDTQRSTGRMDWVEVPPVREIPWGVRERETAQRKLEARLPDRLIRGITHVLEGLAEGIPFPGMEFLLPLFHPSLDTLLDYLPEPVTVVLEDPRALEEEGERFWERIEGRVHDGSLPLGKLISPEEIYLRPEEAARQMQGRAILSLEGLHVTAPGEEPGRVVPFPTASHDGLRAELLRSAGESDPLGRLSDKFGDWLRDGLSIHWVLHSSAQAERLREHLASAGLPCRSEEPPGQWRGTHPRLWIHVGELSRGFVAPHQGLVFLNEEEVFGPQRLHRTHRPARKLPTVTHLEDLQDGDLVVHVEHGIGIYRGLRTLEAGGVRGDFLCLEYLGGDRLYVPVDRFQSVHKYLGSEGILPRLDRLGGGGWETRKRRVQKAVERMAKELLELYAVREVTPGHAFSPPDPMYEEFQQGFVYEETPDQRRAIEEVMADMSNPRPMDRLICGDVGFGKTEVAMRAAFRAVMDGKQVAYLVPTTILAEQHYQTFLARFRGYPVLVEPLSRFRTSREQRAILQRCEEGKVDILVGTHRLLQEDVRFRNLGLLILDEEHRFGVTHKERIKKMRKEVDVLTLSATPIPRTLHMALLGIRDLSIIQTPPPERLSIRTVVAPFEQELVSEAVRRELSRGGQVFFVHNRVRGIEPLAAKLREWLPGVRMGVAHGQMGEKDLARVMDRFHHREIDLLICTTIIEAGLDIPTANTILIHDAHKLGLSEMYQIRGRVGRSGHQAYAYLLLPGRENALTSEALRRLQTLQEFSELGAGFRIATRDLEIRGAGTLLGPSQSGHIEAVGFELYTQLMQRAVASLRGEPLPVQVEPEIQLPVHAFIPDSYVPDAHQRLALYRRLTRCQGEDEISSLMEEMEDRFGPLPEQGENLLHLAALRNLLRALGVRLLSLSNATLRVTFDAATPVSPQRLVGLVQGQPRGGIQFLSEDTLAIPLDGGGEDPVPVLATKTLKGLLLDVSIPN